MYERAIRNSFFVSIVALAAAVAVFFTLVVYAAMGAIDIASALLT